MGKSQRDKGSRGQREFKELLLKRDWVVDSITSGLKVEDLIGEHPDGRRYSIEVKYHKRSDWGKFEKQAREQAKVRGLPWMLAVRIHGHKAWVVIRQDEHPTIWR